jgi:hypothetical protein
VPAEFVRSFEAYFDDRATNIPICDLRSLVSLSVDGCTKDI